MIAPGPVEHEPAPVPFAQRRMSGKEGSCNPYHQGFGQVPARCKCSASPANDVHFHVGQLCRIGCKVFDVNFMLIRLLILFPSDMSGRDIGSFTFSGFFVHQQFYDPKRNNSFSNLNTIADVNRNMRY